MTAFYDSGENEVYLGMNHSINDSEHLDDDFLFFCDLEDFKRNKPIELSLMINIELDLISVAYQEEIIGSFKETHHALDFKKILEDILRNNTSGKASEEDIKTLNQFLQNHGSLVETLLGIDINEDYADGLPTVTAHMNYITELAKSEFFDDYKMYCDSADA